MPREALLKSSDLFEMAHLPFSRVTNTEVKMKPKSYWSCTRNLQRGPHLCRVLPGDVCRLPFLPHSLAGDKGNVQHVTLVSALYFSKETHPYGAVISWPKPFTAWRQLVTQAQQLGDVTEVVSPPSGARLRFSADLRTIFGSLVSRIAVISGEMNAAQRPHPGTGASAAACLCVLTAAFDSKAGKYLTSCHHMLLVAFSSLERY